MSPFSPSAPAAGSSPLVEQIHLDTEYLHVTPVFGARLKVAQFTSSGPADGMQDSVAAVTVYGDGRIAYHLTAPAVTS